MGGGELLCVLPLVVLRIWERKVERRKEKSCKCLKDCSIISDRPMGKCKSSVQMKGGGLRTEMNTTEL